MGGHSGEKPRVRSVDDGSEGGFEMEFLIDTHMHSIASGHAYSTIDEMTREAAEKGVTHIAFTEHGPKMPGSCHDLYFSNLKVLTSEKYGVKRLFGCELNILDFNGKIDLPVFLLEQMDITIASFHMPCIKPGSKEQNTEAIINAIKNPYVNIIGHPDDSRYPVDFEAVVQAAKEYHTLLELNNTSLKITGPRVDARGNDIEMLQLCKKHDVFITVGSDAHVADTICDFDLSYELLEEVGFPERLIVNSDYKLLESFLNPNRKRKKLLNQ